MRLPRVKLNELNIFLRVVGVTRQLWFWRGLLRGGHLVVNMSPRRGCPRVHAGFWLNHAGLRGGHWVVSATVHVHACPRVYGLVVLFLVDIAICRTFGHVRVMRDGLQYCGGCVAAAVGLDSEAVEVSGFDEAADSSFVDVEARGDVVGGGCFSAFVDPCGGSLGGRVDAPTCVDLEGVGAVDGRHRVGEWGLSGAAPGFAVG